MSNDNGNKSNWEPHGGRLVNRMVSAEEAADWAGRAGELPHLKLDFRQLSDLYLLGEGAFSPLEGFQNRDEVQSVLRDFRLGSGLVWSIPVVLLVGDEAKDWKPGADVLLYDSSADPVGVLHLEEKFPLPKAEYAEQVFRTKEEKHPGVAWLYGSGDTALGGKVSLFPGWRPHSHEG